MSKKRKGPAQSGQPRKWPQGPVTAENVPYMVENPNPPRVTQERRKSETDQMGKGHTQNPLETAPESHTKQSKGTSRVALAPEAPKGDKRPPSEVVASVRESDACELIDNPSWGRCTEGFFAQYARTRARRGLRVWRQSEANFATNTDQYARARVMGC